ncbi:uncharacterized protein [Euwallacea similis]|uniref:uncharacterized protein n=1 Tax=Euwallacea similis TaxID=1736056 RepID=UPI00344E2DB3
MGNIGSHSTQISGNRLDRFWTPHQHTIRTCPKINSQVKVLPDPDGKPRLRHTNNGDILQSGGTLSGRHKLPLKDVPPRAYSSGQSLLFSKVDNRSHHYRSSQGRLNSQFKSYKSEPDLRNPLSVNHIGKENRSKKKYKAPAPPNGKREARITSLHDGDVEDFPQRRTRLFKTRVETKKESSQITSNSDQFDNKPDVIEEEILANQNTAIYARPNRLSLPAFNLIGSSVDFKEELKQATSRFHDHMNPDHQTSLTEDLNTSNETAKSQIRGEPSGKESSTPEMSPDLRALENQKPRAFYFGMEREDSDVSSSCHAEEEDESSTIALRLRPVLPRKPPQIPHFSPAAAWRLLDARSQDSGISGDARPSFSSSWTPQQDLGDDSSLEEIRKDFPKSVTRHVPHVFSLSLPRDLQPSSFTTLGSSKSGVSNLRKLKRSVSGVLNTLSRRDLEQREFSKDQDNPNWFLSRSAPNSINDNSADSELHISHTTRLMYLPENSTKTAVAEPTPYSLSRSCEDLKMPESLRDSATVNQPWSNGEPIKKTKKFTFQSTVRQIERRKMAEKLSKEAERKEKQRLRELEAMRQVEEEFQKKRAKEKANIRQQLRLYALDEAQWTSLPFEPNNEKYEERQEPEGALSSSASSPSPKQKYPQSQRNGISLETKRITQATQELSEYRQVQRDYKDYRSPTKIATETRVLKQTTVHPEVTCNMPNAKESYHETGNYRKEFAFGMKSSKSVESNQSEDSPQMYRSKFSPITRF